MSESPMYSQRPLAPSHFSRLLLLVVIATFCRCSLSTSTDASLKKEEPGKEITTKEIALLNEEPGKEITTKEIDDVVNMKFKDLKRDTLDKTHPDTEKSSVARIIFEALKKKTLKEQTKNHEDLMIYTATLSEDDSKFDALKAKYGNPVIAKFDALKTKYGNPSEIEALKADANSYITVLFGETLGMRIKLTDAMTVEQFLKQMKTNVEKRVTEFHNPKKLEDYLKSLEGYLKRPQEQLSKAIKAKEKLKAQLNALNEKQAELKKLKSLEVTVKAMRAKSFFTKAKEGARGVFTRAKEGARGVFTRAKEGARGVFNSFSRSFSNLKYSSVH